MKNISKILILFSLLFMVTLYLSVGREGFAGAWIQYNNLQSRAVSYHQYEVHSSIFYTYGDPGY